MSALSLAVLSLLVLATSFLSGVMGMAGGMILMGCLIFMMPVPTAMILHGVAQMTSNGWRAALWRSHTSWRIVWRYGIGLLLAGLLFSSVRLVPDERIVLVTLGLLPFVALVAPARIAPSADRRWGAETCGFLCTALQFLSGVSGPALDIFFVRSGMDRREVVATKATCQVFTHLAKLLYFGFLLGGAGEGILEPAVIAAAIGFAMLGTTLSRPVLERLGDRQFRRYTQWIVAIIGAVYLLRGLSAFL